MNNTSRKLKLHRNSTKNVGRQAALDTLKDRLLSESTTVGELISFTYTENDKMYTLLGFKSADNQYSIFEGSRIDSNNRLEIPSEIKSAIQNVEQGIPSSFSSDDLTDSNSILKTNNSNVNTTDRSVKIKENTLSGIVTETFARTENSDIITNDKLNTKLAKYQEKLTPKANGGISINKVGEELQISCTLDPSVFVIVDSKPNQPSDANKNKIHLVKESNTPNDNSFSEWVWVSDSSGNRWEKLGTFEPSVDLSNYLLKSDFNSYKNTLEPKVSAIPSNASTNNPLITKTQFEQVSEKIPSTVTTDNPLITKTEFDQVSGKLPTNVTTNNPLVTKTDLDNKVSYNSSQKSLTVDGVNVVLGETYSKATDTELGLVCVGDVIDFNKTGSDTEQKRLTIKIDQTSIDNNMLKIQNGKLWMNPVWDCGEY